MTRATVPRTRRPPRSTCWPTTPTSTAAPRRSPRSPSRPTDRWSPSAAAGVTYRPTPTTATSAPATDNFTYTLNGGSTATVRVTVTCVNDAPVVTLSASNDLIGRRVGRDQPHLQLLTSRTSIRATPSRSTLPHVGRRTGPQRVPLTTPTGGSFICRFPDGPATASSASG